MKAFGKIAVKIIAFALIFGLVFAGVQRIFRHKGAAVNYLDERYDAFKDEPADTVSENSHTIECSARTAARFLPV